MAGDFMVVNEFLVEDLKALGLWSADMLEKIKFYDGSIQQIPEIPESLRAKYKEVFEIEPQWLVKAAAYRGRWIDQSQSLNIFYGGTSGRVLSEIYQYAWDLGLKTTYYLRTMGASRIEKSTVNLAKYGASSQGDAAVRSGGEGVPSSVVVQETVAVVHQDRAGNSEGVFASQTTTETRGEPEASPREVVEEVAAAIEHKQVVEGKQIPFEYAGTPQPSSVKTLPERGSSGIPKFSQEAAVKNRPKIEVIGEQCESCSA
jgi:ribonucleotide reductase alpha subunit